MRDEFLKTAGSFPQNFWGYIFEKKKNVGAVYFLNMAFVCTCELVHIEIFFVCIFSSPKDIFLNKPCIFSTILNGYFLVNESYRLLSAWALAVSLYF